MKSLIISSLLLAGFFTQALSTVAWAAFQFHPRLTLAEEYNDNIFLASDNEEEDWITTVEPGISLVYDSRSLNATVDYSLRYRLYKNNDDENLDKFEDVQRANATAIFFQGRPFTLRISETISREALDERDDNEFNDLENRSTLYHLTVSPEYNWRIAPTYALVFGYGYDRLDYVEAAGNDSEEHSGRVSFIKTLTASTDVFVRYQYMAHQSDDEEEFTRQDYSLGMTQQLGGRTTLSVQGGLGKVEYDSGLAADLTTWLLDLAYRQSEALTVSLGYRQDFTLTAADGLTERQEATLRGNLQRESLQASAEVFWNQSDYLLENRQDEAIGIRCDLSKPLAANLTANIDAEYQNAVFDDIDGEEDVDRITLGASFDYLYRRFLTSLGYRYRINESDRDTNDYTNNIVALSATVRF